MTYQLFGEHRTRVGYADQEWAVWVLGMDDIHPQDSLARALETAHSMNAAFAEMRLRDGDHGVVLYAVVLHHGYAWTRPTEHAHGTVCGVAGCSCSAGDAR